MPLNPPPVITDVFKVILRWSPGNSVTAINRLHFEATGGGNVSALHTALVAHLTTNMFDVTAAARHLQSIGITPLDGTSAETEFSASGLSGNGTGQELPQVCAVVSLRTPMRGPRGRGRVYVGPVTEDATLNGAIGPASVSTMQSAWDTFNTAMTAAAFPLVVASYKHLDDHFVTNILVDAFSGTQRRRQGKLRGA
jgi:hypothetical protein